LNTQGKDRRLNTGLKKKKYAMLGTVSEERVRSRRRSAKEGGSQKGKIPLV